MKFLKIASIAIFAFASAGANADFMSGTGDGCTGCTLNDQTDGHYVDPTGTDLDGAVWIQPDGSWNTLGQFSVWELDLSNTGFESIINSLFVAYDDSLMMKIAGSVVWNSSDYAIVKPWTQVIDVIGLLGHNLTVPGDGRLTFYVNNTGGPAGVIWKGTTSVTAVPEPGTLALLGLGLAGIGFAKRKKA